MVIETTWLYTHHYNLIQEHLLKRNLQPMSVTPHLPQPLTLSNHWSSVSMGLPVLDISCKWNQTMVTSVSAFFCVA